MKNGIARSPLFYVGDKYKLVRAIKANFPQKINRLIEPFVGGGSVMMNVEAQSFILNDIDKNVIALHKMLCGFAKKKATFYEALKAEHFSITESAKEDEYEYFEQLGSFSRELELLIDVHRDKVEVSTKDYNQKNANIISSYKLSQEMIEQLLFRVSSGDYRGGKDVFWFIQAPVKFEFLLTLYVYTYFGDSLSYKPNYICDESGIPYSHAPGNVGDIEIYGDDSYWLIEATLIRNKNQQVNNETVNLFRHIEKEGERREKYITLVAPFIHDDTQLIFNVASLITLIKHKLYALYADAQTTTEFVEMLKTENYHKLFKRKCCDFILDFKNEINKITLS